MFRLCDKCVISEYIKTDDRHLNFDGVRNTAAPSGMTEEDLRKIVKQAKDSHMTIAEYLMACGFDIQGRYLVIGPKNETATFA